MNGQHPGFAIALKFVQLLEDSQMSPTPIQMHKY